MGDLLISLRNAVNHLDIFERVVRMKKFRYEILLNEKTDLTRNIDYETK